MHLGAQSKRPANCLRITGKIKIWQRIRTEGWSKNHVLDIVLQRRRSTARNPLDAELRIWHHGQWEVTMAEYFLNALVYLDPVWVGYLILLVSRTTTSATLQGKYLAPSTPWYSHQDGYIAWNIIPNLWHRKPCHHLYTRLGTNVAVSLGA